MKLLRINHLDGELLGLAIEHNGVKYAFSIDEIEQALNVRILPGNGKVPPDPEGLSVFGENRDQARDRRERQREIIALLHSDLYKRVSNTDTSSLFRSPVGWQVTIQMQDTDQWVIITDPSGREYNRLRNPSAADVDKALP